MAKRYRPLDEFNETLQDQESEQLAGFEYDFSFTDPKDKRKTQVPIVATVENLTPEQTRAQETVDANLYQRAVENKVLSDPYNPLMSDEYFTSGGLQYDPLQEPSDFKNFWNLTFGTANEIHADALRGHKFRNEAKIKDLESKTPADAEEALSIKKEIENLREQNLNLDEDILGVQTKSEEQKNKVSDLYYARAAAGQSEEATGLMDYVGSAEMGQDLGGALSDLKYMGASVALGAVAASAPAATAAAAGMGLGPGGSAIAGATVFGIGTVGSAYAAYQMRANESASEMYSAYQERYKTLVDNFVADNNGEQPSEEQLAFLDAQAKTGAEQMYNQNMALLGSDIAQVAIGVVPWSNYMRLGKIPFLAKKWSDTAKKIGKFGLILGAEGTLEGFEEAYQYITKEQYKLGMYDRYDQTEFPFLKAMINAPYIGERAAEGMVDMFAHRSANGLTNTEEFRNSTRAGMALGFAMGGVMGTTVQPLTERGAEFAQRYTLGNEIEELGASFSNNSWEENLDIEQVSQKVNAIARSLENNNGANLMQAFRLFQEDQEKAGNPNNIDFEKLQKSLKTSIDIYNMHRRNNPKLTTQDLLNITKGHEYLNHYIKKAGEKIKVSNEQKEKLQNSEEFDNAFSEESKKLKTAHNLNLEIKALDRLLNNTKEVESQAKKLGRFSKGDLEKSVIDNNKKDLNQILKNRKEILEAELQSQGITEKELNALGSPVDDKIVEAVANQIGAEVNLKFLGNLRAPLLNPNESFNLVNHPFVKDVAKNEEAGKEAREQYDKNREEENNSVETDDSEVKEGDKAWYQGNPFEYVGKLGKNYILKPLTKTGNATIAVGKDVFEGLRKLVSKENSESEIQETVNEQYNNSIENEDTKKGKESAEDIKKRSARNSQSQEAQELKTTEGSEPVVKPGEQFVLFLGNQIDEGYRDYANININKDQFNNEVYRFFHERSKDEVEDLDITYSIDRGTIPNKIKKLWLNKNTRPTIIKYLKENREEAIEFLTKTKVKVIAKDLANNQKVETTLFGVNETSSNEEINNLIDTFGSILQLTPTSSKEEKANPIKGKISHTNYGVFNNITVEEGDRIVPAKYKIEEVFKDESENQELLFAWQNNDDQILLGEDDIQATLERGGTPGGIYLLYRHRAEGQIIGTPTKLNIRKLAENESSVVFDIYKRMLLSQKGTETEFTFSSDYNAPGFSDLSATQVLKFILAKAEGTNTDKVLETIDSNRRDVEISEMSKRDLQNLTGIKFTTGKDSRLFFGVNYIGRNSAELYNADTRTFISYLKSGEVWRKIYRTLGEKGQITVDENVLELSQDQVFEELQDAFNLFTSLNVNHQVAGTVLNYSIFSIEGGRRGFDLKDSIEFFGRIIKKGTPEAVYSNLVITGENPVLTTDVQKVGVKGKERVQKNRQVVVSPTDITVEVEKVEVAPEPKEEPITDSEYTEFVNKGIVTKERIDSLANKIINNTTLSEREQAIFADKTSEINARIVELTPIPEPAVEETEKETTTDPDVVIKKKGKKGFGRKLGSKKPMVVTAQAEEELPLINIEEARAYLRKVLGTKVPVYVEEGLLRVGKKGTKAYGYFADGAITLSKMGRSSVEYHEAYHAVEDLYLTPSQIESLNKETVKTYEEPTQESISEIMKDRGIDSKAARQYILSEYRAEEFRAYELNRLDMSTISEKLKFFFDTLKDYIMEIFKGPNSKSLYRQIAKGKYAKQDTTLNLYRLLEREEILSEQEQNLDDFGINEVDRFNITKGLFYEYVKESINAINEDSNLKLVSVRNIEDIEEYFSKESFIDILDSFIEEAEIETQKENLQVIKDNFDVFISDDLTGLIPQFLNSLNISYNTEEEYKDAVDSNDDLQSIKAPYEFKSLDSATVSTKLLFELLPNKDESGNILLDAKTGLPSIASGNFVYTQMQKVLSNIDHIYNDEGVFVSGFNQMKEKLDLMSNSIPVFKGFASDILDNLTEQQQSQFYRVMSMKDYSFVSLLEYSYTGMYMEEGVGLQTYTSKNINLIDSAQQGLVYRLINKWFENYKTELFKFGKDNEIIVKNKNLLEEVANDFVTKVQAKRQNLKTNEDINAVLKDLSDILNKIGIDISEQALINYANSYEKGQKQAITDLIIGKGKKPGVQNLFITKSLYSIKDILNNLSKENVTTNDFNLDTNNTLKNNNSVLKNLGEIAALSEENLTGSTINVEGKTYWTFSLPNFIFNTVDRLTSSTKEISNKLEDRWTKGSKYLENSSAFKILTFANFRNTDSGKKGKTYTDLGDREYMSNSINKMLKEPEKGVVNFPTFADKSTWYMLQGARVYDLKGDFVNYNKEEGLVIINKNSNEAKDIGNLFAGYAIEEAERIAQVEEDLKTLKDDQLTVTFHYTEFNEDGTADRTSGKGLQMLLFPSLNNDEILKEVGLKNSDNSWTVNKNIKDIKEKLRPYILNILESKIQKDLDNAVTNNILEKDSKGIYKYLNNKVSPLDSKIRKAYNNPVKLIGAFSTNSIIANVEATKIFSGDPAYYKNDEDLTKRIVSIIAPGSALNLTKESFYKAAVVKDFELNSATLVKNYAEFLKGKGYTDSEIKRTLKAYNEVNVTDGQALITLERWRDIMIGLGDVDRNTIEAAYQRLNDPKGKPTTEDVQLVMAQPLKGMLFSRRDSEVHGKAEQIPTYLKYSQAVLIPAFVEDKADIGELLKAMKRDGVDEVIFESGIKAGALFPTKIVGTDGKLLLSEDISFNIMQLDNRDWKLQQPLSPHKTLEQLEGSQVKKNILSGVKLIEDYKIPYTYKDEKGKYRSGTKTVKGYQLVQEFHEIDRALSEIEFEALKKDWGIEGDINTGYVIRDVEALKDALQKDFAKDDAVADKILQLLAIQEKRQGNETIKEFVINFDNNPFDDVIERKLASILTKRLVKLNMPGGSYIQTSAFGMTKPQRFTDLTKAEQTELREQMFPFNRLNAAMWDRKTGKAKGAQIFLPNYMKKLIPNNVFNNKAELEKYIKDNRLLEAIGYRIPNQGLSSIDALEIVGFLPQAYGDTIIAYDEITAKTGSDFDIDKMYVMLPSFNYIYEKDEEGKDTKKVKGVRYVNFDSSKDNIIENIRANAGNKNSKKALRNRKLELYRALLQDENTFADLINPLDSVDVKNNSMFVRYLEAKTNLSKEDIALAESLYSIDENGDYKFEDKFYKTVSRLLDKNKEDLDWYTFSNQMRIREIYLGGKFGVGQEARHIVDHAISQWSPEWEKNNLESPYYFSGIDFGIGNITPEGSSDLSQISVRNSKVSIASVLSSRLDGYVDIAKDPYIFYINNNYLTANTVALMDRLGTDPQWTDLFMSLPIIKEYVTITKNITAGNIPSLSITENGKKIEKSFYKAENYITRKLQEQINERLSEEDRKSDVTEIRSKNLANPKSRRELLSMLRNIEVEEDQRVLVEDIYSKQYLAKLIDSSRDGYSIQDLRALLGFIQYFMELKNKATLLNEAVTASKYDTQGARGGFSQARIFEGLYKRLASNKTPLKGFIERFQGTMAGKYKEMGPDLMKELFGDMFLLGDDTYFGVLEKIANATKHSRDIRENEEFIRNLHRNFRSFLYTETDYFRSIDIRKLLYSSDNISVRLSKAQSQESDIKDNLFIKYLTAESKTSFEGFPYIIAPARVAKSGKEKNILTKAWADLLNSSDPQTRKLGEDLYKFSIIASGFRNGMYTFHELVPLEFEMETGIYEEFGRVANEIKEDGDINNEYATKFIMSQMSNADIVPEVDGVTIENAYKANVKSPNSFVIGIKENSKYKFEVSPMKKEKGEIVAYPEYVPFVSMLEGRDQVRRLYKFQGLDNLGTQEEPKFIPIYKMLDGFNFTGRSRRVYEPITVKGSSVEQNIKKVKINGELRSFFKDPLAKNLRDQLDNIVDKAVKVTADEIEETNQETFAIAPWSNIITNTPTVDEAVDQPTVYAGEVLAPTFKLENPITLFIDSSIRKFDSIKEALDAGVNITDALQLAAKYNRTVQAELESIPEDLAFIESMDDNYNVPGYGLATQRAKMLLDAGVIGYQEIKSEEGITYFVNTKDVNMFLEELSQEIDSREYLKNVKNMINPVVEQSGIEIVTLVTPETRSKLGGVYVSDENAASRGVIVMGETKDAFKNAVTLLHELLHNITAEGVIKDPKLKSKVKALLDLYAESNLINDLTPALLKTYIKEYKEEPTNFEKERKVISEFITYGLTDQAVVAQLKKLKITKESAQASQLDIFRDTVTSAFNKLIDIVLDVFGYTKENTDLNAYNLLNETVGEFISQASKLQQGKKFREEAIISILTSDFASQRVLRTMLNKESTILKKLSTEINKKCN